jgi:phosphatidylserine synthase
LGKKNNLFLNYLGKWGSALDRLGDLLNFAVIPANIILKGMT